jgi:hypothetical protein
MENIQEEIENKVVDYINSGAGGRLIIFKPEKALFGADLAVKRRGKYKEKEIYLQINSFIAPAEAKIFVKDFSEEDFKTDKNFYLLFVYFDEVLQKISDYIWLIPSSQFKDTAQVVKLRANKNLLRFETPLDIKQKNKYSKFIVNTKELGKTILYAFEKGGKFIFEEIPETKEVKPVNLESLKEFLCNARRNTYAASSTPIDNPRLSASIQLEFQKGDYFYRDIYFSGDKGVVGQEIIYQNLKPVWGMNYIEFKIVEMNTNFLKESLLKLFDKCRLGQVCEYEKRELKYQDKGEGNFEKFSGEEKIFSEGKNIYKLNYQGGLISDKL